MSTTMRHHMLSNDEKKKVKARIGDLITSALSAGKPLLEAGPDVQIIKSGSLIKVRISPPKGPIYFEITITERIVKTFPPRVLRDGTQYESAYSPEE